jgi:hypothetical protein
MDWTPRPTGDATRASAVQIVKAILAIRDQITTAALRKVLDVALWLYTEADGKYNTRYRSRAAVGVTDTRLLAHEHVIPRQVLIDRLVADPDETDAIMATVVGCVVLRTEHSLLSGHDGWTRYRTAGVEVVDLRTGASP